MRMRVIKPEFPVKELIQDNQGTYAIFGPKRYRKNLEEMSEDFSHPITGEKISFRPATTSESIRIASDGFGEDGEFDAKKDIHDSRWNQTGYIVRTPEGVFTNTQELDEKTLMNMLNKAEKVNGIYLINDTIAFAPYESFKINIHDGEAGVELFTQGGLARALEHTKEKTAENLGKIASHYKRAGVNVCFFDDVKEPDLRVLGLGSSENSKGMIVGDSWKESFGGYAFGVLENYEEGK